MTFDQVINDFQKMIGLKLESINPGSEITVVDVDLVSKKIIIKTNDGKLRSRSFNELKNIWDSLCLKKAIHVDEVLHGSGTSRNQPETLFANLAYVEWLKIDNKKHISYLRKNTHAFGTLRRMDEISTIKVKEEIKVYSSEHDFQTIVVTREMLSFIRKLTTQNYMVETPINQSMYALRSQSHITLVIDSVGCTLSEGVYPVYQSSKSPNKESVVELLGRKYYVESIGGLNILFKMV